MSEDVYFNEPGYHTSFGTTVGMAQSELYNKNIRYNTVKWGMCDMITNPPEVFREVIMEHFKLKKNHIIKEIGEWLLNDDPKSSILFKELCSILDKL
jgi:baculoviral IAP repeat-containing protein 6